MANEMIATNLDLQPGVCIKVVGDVHPEAKCFRVNLGKDELNLALHFNPRFNACDDTNTIICNSRQEGSWGTEQRETNFPFLPGTKVEELVASNLNLKPGTVVRVVGEISPGARTFKIDMGTNENNVALHFNPRFEYQGDRNTVIFNSKHDGKYGKEHRERHFPFLKGTTVEVLIEFEGTSFVVKLPDGYRMTFPNRTEITKIEYLAVFGDMSVKALAFE